MLFELTHLNYLPDNSLQDLYTSILLRATEMCDLWFHSILEFNPHTKKRKRLRGGECVITDQRCFAIRDIQTVVTEWANEEIFLWNHQAQDKENLAETWEWFSEQTCKTLDALSTGEFIETLKKQ